MLISRDALGGATGWQGCRPATLADLRQQLAMPLRLSEEHRQRLLELTQRVARVQAMGGRYGRVSLSEHAALALRRKVAVV
jgi:hypothetical protein